ncbi:MAG: NACHT domain-containing protein [Goleter apudmare HA4340-LM2]|jgi:SpoVK/Ycf46/Vps4 family AAA+-type ATPase|nr:NACHT domain-containing protein [Goleter apudmare HA4340-LM2]
MAKRNTFVEPSQSSLEEVTFDEALLVIDELVFTKIGRHLSDAEVLVMKGAWNDDDYEEISKNSTYTVNYLQRHLAPQLWNIISATIGSGERITKKKLRDFLEKLSLEKYGNSEKPKLNQGQPLPNKLIEIRGEPPSLSNFYGRASELKNIRELINRQKYVFLIGIAGIGKTSLAAKVLTDISVNPDTKFNCLVWKSVAHAPSVQDLVTDLIELIQPIESSSLQTEYPQAKITILLKAIQSRRCLIVLDEVDAIFQNSDFEQKLDYKLFFRRLIEEQHQSSLLLTSRIFPNEFDNFIKNNRPIQYLKIKGLDVDAAMQILTEQGLTDKEKCYELIKTYYGNPSELKAVVERIHHFFAGSTEIFFENKTTFVSRQFQQMLNDLFKNSLNQIQRQIMLFLAQQITVNSQFVSFKQLLNEFNHNPEKNISTSELVEALEELERQSLIESVKNTISKEISFTLQPVIKKYIFTDPLGLIKTFNLSQTSISKDKPQSVYAS